MHWISHRVISHNLLYKNFDIINKCVSQSILTVFNDLFNTIVPVLSMQDPLTLKLFPLQVMLLPVMLDHFDQLPFFKYRFYSRKPPFVEHIFIKPTVILEFLKPLFESFGGVFNKFSINAITPAVFLFLILRRADSSSSYSMCHLQFLHHLTVLTTIPCNTVATLGVLLQ